MKARILTLWATAMALSASLTLPTTCLAQRPSNLLTLFSSPVPPSACKAHPRLAVRLPGLRWL
jgi:hypothetical protein